MHMKKTKTETEKVTEEVKKDPRASETREATKRPVEWTPPSSLDAPPAPDGFRHRWIRAESLGFDDTKNIAGKLRSGYVLVMASEYERHRLSNCHNQRQTQGSHRSWRSVAGQNTEMRSPKHVKSTIADKAKERDDAVKHRFTEGSAPEHAYQL